MGKGAKGAKGGKQVRGAAVQVRPVRAVSFQKKGAGRQQAPPSGKGGGQWVYIPNGVSVGKALSTRPVVGRAAKGNGRGPPAPAAQPKLPKYEEKLKKMDSSLKVWIGGLAEGTTWKQVEEHFSAVAKPSVTDIMKRGTAVVAYKTIEDVETAVASLNGSELNGSTLEVDVWVKAPKPERGEKPKKQQPQQKQKLQQQPQQKQKLQQKAKAAAAPVKKGALKQPNKEVQDKMKEKLAAFSAAQKVWVGGLSEKTTWKGLEKHLAEVAKPKVTNIWKGKGCVAYESEDDVATVIAALNGSELDGSVLEVDTWTKPEGAERKAKAVKMEQ
jgi:RNA recognition motif-containing protein